MGTGGHLTLLRAIGGGLGLLLMLWSFARFRRRRIRRGSFFWIALFSVALAAVAIEPRSIDSVASMLSLENREFGRLIALLVLSNIALWLFVFGVRGRNDWMGAQFDRLVRHLGVEEFRRTYPEASTLPPVVVVIPAYNEADNIGHVLEAMPKSVCGKALAAIVVDDGSYDDTLRVAREAGAYAVRSPINRGGGATLRMAFDIARELGAEIMVTMDADGQHLPAEIERLVEPIASGEHEIVIGSRLKGTREKDSVVRLVGIYVFNAVIRILTPVQITDCSSGYRALRADVLDRLKLRQDQYHTTELIVDASRQGIRIGEAPITIMRRLSGESKKGGNWTYGFGFARAIFKTWWR